MFDLNPLNNPNATWQHWLLAIVAGLIGFVIGYLQRRGEISALEPEFARLETEVDECLGSLARTAERTRTATATAGMSFVAPLVGTTAAPDDLKIVEGIGPKIEELLNREGIRSFAQLAAADPDRLMTVLRAAGPRFQIQDPTTWPRQAQLAADSRWDELKELQRQLTAGRE